MIYLWYIMIHAANLASEIVRRKQRSGSYYGYPPCIDGHHMSKKMQKDLLKKGKRSSQSLFWPAKKDSMSYITNQFTYQSKAYKLWRKIKPNPPVTTRERSTEDHRAQETKPLGFRSSTHGSAFFFLSCAFAGKKRRARSECLRKNHLRVVHTRTQQPIKSTTAKGDWAATSVRARESFLLIIANSEKLEKSVVLKRGERMSWRG